MKTHLEQLFAKIGVDNRAAGTSVAMRTLPRRCDQRPADR